MTTEITQDDVTAAAALCKALGMDSAPQHAVEAFAAYRQAATRRQAMELLTVLGKAQDLMGENADLRRALHDAINRPKGVVPHRAERFYNPDLCK